MTTWRRRHHLELAFFLTLDFFSLYLLAFWPEAPALPANQPDSTYMELRCPDGSPFDWDSGC